METAEKKDKPCTKRQLFFITGFKPEKINNRSGGPRLCVIRGFKKTTTTRSRKTPPNNSVNK